MACWGVAIGDGPQDEFSSHGRDPRFADGRMTVLLLVLALGIAVIAAIIIF